MAAGYPAAFAVVTSFLGSSPPFDCGTLEEIL
jgi:hypothetical protein